MMLWLMALSSSSSCRRHGGSALTPTHTHKCACTASSARFAPRCLGATGAAAQDAGAYGDRAHLIHFRPNLGDKLVCSCPMVCLVNNGRGVGPNTVPQAVPLEASMLQYNVHCHISQAFVDLLLVCQFPNVGVPDVCKGFAGGCLGAHSTVRSACSLCSSQCLAAIACTLPARARDCRMPTLLLRHTSPLPAHPLCRGCPADLARHALCALPAQDNRHNHHRDHHQKHGELKPFSNQPQALVSRPPAHPAQPMQPYT